MPWVIPFEGLEQAKRIVRRGEIPRPDTALGLRVYDTCCRMREVLSQFPNCGRFIRVTQPDMQGPFDILHLLLGTDVFYYVCDEEKLMSELLDMITETIIGYKKYITPVLNDDAGGGAIYIHAGIYPGRLLLKDDTATANISQAMYECFAKPYNQRLFDTFGAGSVHFCGKPKSWHYHEVMAQSMIGVNFGNPEYHDLSGGAKTLLDNHISVISYGTGQPYALCEQLVKSGIRTGVTLATLADSAETAKDIAARHRNLTADGSPDERNIE
jgi:hypothetical protein